jgi:hypothetical protein
MATRSTDPNAPQDAGKLESEKGMHETPAFVGNFSGDPVASGQLTEAEAEKLRQQGGRS